MAELVEMVGHERCRLGVVDRDQREIGKAAVERDDRHLGFHPRGVAHIGRHNNDAAHRAVEKRRDMALLGLMVVMRTC